MESIGLGQIFPVREIGRAHSEGYVMDRQHSTGENMRQDDGACVYPRFLCPDTTGGNDMTRSFRHAALAASS